VAPPPAPQAAAPPPPSPEPPPGPVPRPRPAVPVSPEEARRNEILDAFLGLRTLTHYELLEIERGASDAQVKEAYFRMAKRFHPDVHHDRSLHDLRDKLEAVFIRLGEAYEVLRNPRVRAGYEKTLDTRAQPGAPVTPGDGAAGGPVAGEDPAREARMAEEAIRKAARSVAAEKYWEAIQLLELLGTTSKVPPRP